MLAVNSGFLVNFHFFIIFNGGYKATPLQVARVPLLVGESIPCQRCRQALSFLLTWGYLPVLLPPCSVWPCLPWPSSMSGCIGHWVHYVLASMDIDVFPSALHMCSFWSLQPHHITWGLHLTSVDAPVDIHSGIRNFPFFHPREALLVGHQVTALPLFSCSSFHLLLG